MRGDDPMTSTRWTGPASGRHLPSPLSESWSWQAQAACRGMPSARFFHPWNERGGERDRRIAQAKQICARCPVVDSCLQHALQAHEMYGIWGGLSEDERLALLNPRRHRKLRDRGLRAGGTDSSGPVRREEASPARS